MLIADRKEGRSRNTRGLGKRRMYACPRALNDEDHQGRVIICVSTRTPHDARGWPCIYERYILIAQINSGFKGSKAAARGSGVGRCRAQLGKAPAGEHVAKTNRSRWQAPAMRSGFFIFLGRIGLLKINDSGVDVNMMGCVSRCEPVRVGVPFVHLVSSTFSYLGR